MPVTIPMNRQFESLKPGDAIRSRGRTITETDIVTFAALTGDWHPAHMDAVWASEHLFGERIAHGMLVLSFAVGLVPIDPDLVIAMRRVRSATFKRPVHIGDTISVIAKIAGAKPLDDKTGLLVCDWKVVDQRDETVLRATVEVLCHREPPGDDGQARQGDLDVSTIPV